MRYRIIKIAALLVLAINLSSCIFHHVRTDNRRPSHEHYRKAGRAW